MNTLSFAEEEYWFWFTYLLHFHISN